MSQIPNQPGDPDDLPSGLPDGPPKGKPRAHRQTMTGAQSPGAARPVAPAHADEAREDDPPLPFLRTPEMLAKMGEEPVPTTSPAASPTPSPTAPAAPTATNAPPVDLPDSVDDERTVAFSPPPELFEQTGAPGYHRHQATEAYTADISATVDARDQPVLTYAVGSRLDARRLLRRLDADEEGVFYEGDLDEEAQDALEELLLGLAPGEVVTLAVGIDRDEDGWRLVGLEHPVELMRRVRRCTERIGGIAAVEVAALCIRDEARVAQVAESRLIACGSGCPASWRLPCRSCPQEVPRPTVS